MSIKSTEVAPIEPLLGTKVVAHVTRKAHVRVRSKGCKIQLVMMRLVGEHQGHCRTCGMDINVASSTMVRETISLLPTRITVE